MLEWRGMDELNRRVSANKIILALRDAANRLGLPDSRILLTPVKNPKFGSFSTNLAMVLSPKIGEGAVELARRIAAAIDLPSYDIEEVRVEAPGFINFYIDINFFGSELNTILSQGRGWLDAGVKRGKIILEYLSSNPTGYLHIGHARNAVVGGVLARCFKLAGYEVVSEFYLNDYGNQVEELVDSVLARYQQLIEPGYEPDRLGYGGRDIILCAKSLQASLGVEGLGGDRLRAKVKEFSLNYFLEEALKDAAKLGASFDRISRESEYYRLGLVDGCFDELKRSGNLLEEGGAWLLRSTNSNDDKDRVLRRSDGRYTYLLPDLAYHKEKLSRYPDLERAIDILGSDHSGYTKRLSYGLSILGSDTKKLDLLLIQQVRIIKEGEEVKMSKRSGNSIWLRDLVGQVGRDYATFSLLNRSVNSTIDIDTERLGVRDLNNPTYAIQYSYARAKQLLVKGAQDTYSYKGTSEPLVNGLIKLILEWPEVIKAVVRTLKPELVSSYSLRLAQRFNSFYSQVRVVGSQDEANLLAVVKAFEVVQAQVMETIGLRVLDEVAPWQILASS